MDEWLTLHPSHFTSSTQWIGGWVGTRAGLDRVVTRKNPVTAPLPQTDPLLSSP
jgi:hypothetical protein